MSEKTSEEWKGEGNTFLKSRKFMEAIDCYTKAITLDPSNHALYSNRSLCYCQLSQFENGINDAKKCIELKPDWFKGYLRESQCYKKSGIFHECLSSLAKGMGKCTGPGKSTLEQLSRDMSQELMRKPKEMHQLQAFQVHTLFNIPDFENVFISRHPTQAKLLLKDNMFKMKVEKIQESTTETLKFLQDPQIELALGILSGQLLKQEKERERKLRQEEEEAERRRQRIREEAERAKKKEEELKKKENEKPENQLKLKGNAKFKAKEFEEAIDFYKQAMKLNEKEMNLYFNISACYLNLENYEEAIKIAEEGLEMGKSLSEEDDPLIFQKMAKGYSRIGNVLMKQKKYAEALEMFKTSSTESKTKQVTLKITQCKNYLKRIEEEAYWDEEKSELEKQKGNGFFKKSEFVKAIPCYREAIKRNPKNPSLYLNMGTAYMKLCQYPEAIIQFDKAIKKDPKYMKAYNRKASCYEQHFMHLPNDQKGKLGLQLLLKASNAVSVGLKECGQDSVMLQNTMKRIYGYMSMFTTEK